MKLALKIIKIIFGVALLVFATIIAAVTVVFAVINDDDDLLVAFILYSIMFISFLVPFLLGLRLVSNFSLFRLFKKKKEANKLVEKIEENKKRIDKNTYVIEFPFCGYKENEESLLINGKDVYNLLSKEDIDKINNTLNSQIMIGNISFLNIINKVNKIDLFTCKSGVCRVFIKVFEELEDKEKNQLLDFILKEVTNKFNKNNLCFKGNDGKEYKLLFKIDSNDWFIKYTDSELKEKFISEYKNRTGKECYKIDLIEEEPSIMDNKLGGKPYIPINEEYPVDEKGLPMMLLLQLNLKDINLEGYPEKGILEIFVEQDYDYPLKYKVKYFDDNLEYRNDLPVIENVEYPMVDKSYKIKLSKAVDYMPSSDFRGKELLPEVVSKIYEINALEYDPGYDNYKNKHSSLIFNFIEEVSPKITVGGYANFNQGDPRYNGDMPDKTECVFKLDSNYDINKISLGDSGILYTLISPEKIKNADFEDMFIDYDCC